MCRVACVGLRSKYVRYMMCWSREVTDSHVSPHTYETKAFRFSHPRPLSPPPGCCSALSLRVGYSLWRTCRLRSWRITTGSWRPFTTSYGPRTSTGSPARRSSYRIRSFTSSAYPPTGTHLSLSPLHPGVPVHYTRLFLPDLHTRRLSYTGTLPTGRAGCVARTRRPSSTRKSTAPLPTARARTATWWRATSARGACLRPPIPTLGSLRRRRR